MLKRLLTEARFTLMLENTGPLLIKSGITTLAGADMTPVKVFRHNDWEVYIPGSSLKGVVRSHLEKIGRSIAPAAKICNPLNIKPNDADHSCGATFQERGGASITNEEVYRQSCPMCRLFGSTFFIGRIAIGDAYLASDSSGHIERRDGVGIDRQTGGAYQGAKFDLEVVSPGARFLAPIFLRNFEIWQLGAILTAVQDLQDGIIRLGSGRSRGLGAVRGSIYSGEATEGLHTGLDVNYLGTSHPPTTELWGLGKLLGDGSYGTFKDDFLPLPAATEQSQVGIRTVMTFQEERLRALMPIAIRDFSQRLEHWPASRDRTSVTRTGR